MTNFNIQIEQSVIDKLLVKWEVTGLLQSLSEDKARKISTLLENETQYLLYRKKDKNHLSEDNASNLLLPIIRRVFSSDKLKFEFDVTNRPTFKTINDSISQAYSVNTERLRTNFPLESINDLGQNNYHGLDAEVEFCAIITDKLIEEFNEKLENKNVVFFTPLELWKKQENKNDFGFWSRYVIL